MKAAHNYAKLSIFLIPQTIAPMEFAIILYGEGERKEERNTRTEQFFPFSLKFLLFCLTFFTFCADNFYYKLCNICYKLANTCYKLCNACYKLCNKLFLIR